MPGKSSHLVLVRALASRLRKAEMDVEGPREQAVGKRSALLRVCADIGQSWSQSWIGYHAMMYFGDLERPPASRRWDPEWGAMEGMPEGWRERDPEEIQREIEARAGTSIAEIAPLSKAIAEELRPLFEDIVTGLSPICDLQGFERERGLLEALEKDLGWSESEQDFIRARLPSGQFSSRDSTAIHQGLLSPPHITYEAGVLAASVPLHVMETCVPQARRLLRQVESKLQVEDEPANPVRRNPPPPKSTQAVIEAPVGGPSPNWERRARVTSMILFALLGLMIAAGTAWSLNHYDPDLLVQAVAIVLAGLGLAGLYAVLIDAHHAKRAVAGSVLVIGAVASVYQLLTPA
jgi:hypothetical protein